MDDTLFLLGTSTSSRQYLFEELHIKFKYIILAQKLVTFASKLNSNPDLEAKAGSSQAS
jgi:hypothetical protein